MAIAHSTVGFRPDWLPDSISAYLDHVERGRSIRDLARERKLHASTVMRQVRRTEMLRDDPLADAALSRLGRAWRQKSAPTARVLTAKDEPAMTSPYDVPAVDAETLQVLKEMMTPHAVLILSDGVKDAAVIDMPPDVTPLRKCVVRRELAEALLLRGFVEGGLVRTVYRYRITALRRTEVIRLTAKSESRRATVLGQAEDVDADPQGIEPRRPVRAKKRSAGAESPLAVLARRKGPDGGPFLTRAQVAAALRFREDFEIARMDPQVTANWEQLICGRISGQGTAVGAPAPARRLDAIRALERAIRRLGPDLAEVALLAICEEVGMETIEERKHYSARSGKNVTQIALNMLALHYDAIGSGDHDMIG